MAAMVFGCLFLLAGVVAIIAGTLVAKSGRGWFILAGIVALIVGPLIVVLSGINSVPTKSVGVVTSFGRVGAEYGPGGHWLWPWKTLAIVSDTIQSDSFAQANGNGPDQPTASGVKGYCITVRLAGLNEGCIDVQLQTQVIPQAIPSLYANYSSYGANLTQDVDEFVVQRELRTDLNRVLGDYNVIADVSASLQACSTAATTNCTTATSQFSQFDPIVLNALRNDPELKGNVNVLDVNLQYPHFSGSVEAAIESIQAKYQETVAATIQEKTNLAISAANAALTTKAGALSPQVLQNECYQTIQMAIKAGYSGLPATLSCGSGNSAGVLVQSGK